MKVICINAEGYLDSDNLLSNDDDGIIEDGEVYNVENAYIYEGFCWYVLAEDLEGGYDSRRFERFTQANDAVEQVNDMVEQQQAAAQDIAKAKRKWWSIFT